MAVKPGCRRCHIEDVPLIKRLCPDCTAVIAEATLLMKKAAGLRTTPKSASHVARAKMVSPAAQLARAQRARQLGYKNRGRKRTDAKMAAVQKLAALSHGGPVPPEVAAEMGHGAVPPPPEVTTPEPALPSTQVAADPTIAAKQELAQRELARRKLLWFVRRCNPKYKAGWFHIDLCERLEKFKEDVLAERSPRLMLFVPPRHGKSYIVSQDFPAWFLGDHPELEFIGASYGADLARDFSYKVQQRLESNEFKAVFPGCEMASERRSLDVWATTKAGQYVAAGVGGPITGRGGNVITIDDPFKNRADADSPVTREEVHRWYTSTAYTRLMPGAGILLVQTRWHDDDLAGRLLAAQAVAEQQFKDTGVWPLDADKWEVINYAAIATADEPHRKAGEALHPERYSLPALLKIKRTIGPRDWSALYQQNPVPDEGGYFKTEWIRYVDTVPDHGAMAIYAAGDLAISKKQSADYSVFMVVGLDHHDNLTVLDVRRGRWDSAEIIDQLFDIQRTWKPKIFGMEEGQIASAIEPFLNKRIEEEKLYELVIEPMKIKGQDKEMRAQSIRGRVKMGKVVFPKNAMWTTDVVNEMLRFPAGVHDDCVDALAWIGQMITSMHNQKPAAQKTKSWRDELHKFIGNNSTSTGRNPAMAA